MTEQIEVDDFLAHYGVVGMTEQVDVDVDDFLAHYGVRGMKWGKRNARSDDRSGTPKSKGATTGGDGAEGTAQPKQGMSRNKKIAIGVGIGAAVAIGAVVAISILNNKQSMSFPVQSLTTNKSAIQGKANLIFGAAAQNAREAASAPKAQKGLSAKVREKAFDKAKNVAINKAQKMSYDDAKSMHNAPPKTGLVDKAKNMAIDKAKDMLFEKAKDQAKDKAMAFAMGKAKAMLTPASSIPAKPAVVFNPKTGLYEEVEPQPANA